MTFRYRLAAISPFDPPIAPSKLQVAITRSPPNAAYYWIAPPLLFRTQEATDFRADSQPVFIILIVFRAPSASRLQSRDATSAAPSGLIEVLSESLARCGIRRTLAATGRHSFVL